MMIPLPHRSAPAKGVFITVALLVVHACAGGSRDDTESGLDTHSIEVTPQIEKVPGVGPRLPMDFKLVEEDRETLSDLGYTFQTWSLDAWAPDPYEALVTNPPVDANGDPVDIRPSFYVLRGTQRDFAPEKALIWLHGGSVADDSGYPETGILPDKCHTQVTIDRSRSPFTKLQSQILAMVDAGWTVLFPRNDWCDGWMGLGPDDPYRPWHFSVYHLNRMLDFAKAGGLEFDFPEEVSLWGTSSGGSGAIYWASHRPEFHSLATDSSPNNWFDTYDSASDLALSHFGGPPVDEDGNPSVYYSEYADATGYTLLESGKLNTPMFLAWNSQDVLVPEIHSTSILEVLEEAPTLLDGRWVALDFNRYYPGETWHVQTNTSSIPGAYAGWAVLSFLEGHHLTFIEAEEGCDVETPCDLGEVVEADKESIGKYRALSDSGGLYASSEAGEGLLWSRRIDSLFSKSQSITAVFVIKTEEIQELDPSTVVGEIEITDATGTVVHEFRAGDLFGGEESEEVSLARRLAVLAHLKATTVTFPFTTEGQTTVSFRHKGHSETLLDQVIFSTAWD